MVLPTRATTRADGAAPRAHAQAWRRPRRGAGPRRRDRRRRAPLRRARLRRDPGRPPRRPGRRRSRASGACTRAAWHSSARTWRTPRVGRGACLPARDRGSGQRREGRVRRDPAAGRRQGTRASSCSWASSSWSRASLLYLSNTFPSIAGMMVLTVGLLVGVALFYMGLTAARDARRRARPPSAASSVKSQTAKSSRQSGGSAAVSYRPLNRGRAPPARGTMRAGGAPCLCRVRGRQLRLPHRRGRGPRPRRHELLHREGRARP